MQAMKALALYADDDQTFVCPKEKLIRKAFIPLQLS